MHLTRTTIRTTVPIPRKGTKYIARASSHSTNGIPVVVAVRDILHLAATAKEVKHMVSNKLLMINGKPVKDIKESVRLFNTLKADKTYELTILPTGRFSFAETTEKTRVCKIVNKKILRGNKTQLHLHEGTTILLGKEKAAVDDSVILDASNKITKVIPFAKGAKAFVISGRNIGLKGNIVDVSGKKAVIHFEESGREVSLDTSHIVVR